MASFWLEFEHGGQVQQASFEKDSISIGRDRNSDFILDHPTVSRQHALIVHRGGGIFQLVVLSRGGLTALDQRPVDVPEIALYDGAMITLGQHTLRFRSHQAPSKPGVMGPQGGAGMSGGPAAGFDGMSGTAMPSPASPAPSPSESVDDGGAGIVSWDEIAASSEAMDEQDDVGQSDFDRIRRAKDKGEEKTNPAVVGGALLLAVGFLAFAFLGGGSGDDDGMIGQQQTEEHRALEVDVTCLDQGACRRDALRSFELAEDVLESRDVETGNLFEAYRLLMESRAYLESGGVGDFPEEMSEWQRLHDETRRELDELFGSFRMRYHQAHSRNRYHEMAEVLKTVKAYFPERSSYEYRWARDQEMDLISRGVMPPGSF